MIPFYQKLLSFRLFQLNWKHTKLIGVYAASLFCFYLTNNSFGQINLTTIAPTATQNFDGIATTNLPANWRITHSATIVTTAVTTASTLVTVGTTANLVVGMAVTGTGVPGGATIASIPTGTTFNLSASATIANGTTLLYTNGNNVTWANTANRTSAVATSNISGSSVAGNSYVYTEGDPTPGTDKAVGFQASPTYANPQSIMVNYRNNSGAIMTALSVSYNAKRYRRGTQAASVDFFYSTDGSTWTPVAAGNIATGVFPTGTALFTFGGANPPQVVARTANITGLSLPSGTGNIYIRWNINCVPTSSQAISLDDVSATATFQPCVVPTNQPTVLTFPSVGTGQISGSFTAAAGSPTGYLVVRYPNGATPTNPVDATAYTVGAPLGLGTVVSSSVATSFSATGLAINTAYDFYVYSYNNTTCVGGPIYLTTSPLFATQSTNSCPTFAATINIDAVATRVDGQTYNNLTDALNDLSGCPISQATIIQLQNNYVSTSETFPIKLGAIAGASSLNTLTIRPAAGASNLSITGNSSGAPILDLDGGRWWRVDGRAGGVGTVQNLTVENIDIVNTLGGSSAVRFLNGAQNNIITYVKARSSNKALVGGSINFGGSNTAFGNSNNTVSFCDVYNSSAGLAHTGISSVGRKEFNNANQILNNNIFDFFNVAGNSYGIYLSDSTTNWTISGNSIYQTASRVLTGGAADRNFAAITVNPANFTQSSYGITISNNFIGGSAPNCGGSPMQISDVTGSSTILFRAISADLGNTSPTSIQGNTIQNIEINSSSASSNQSAIAAITGSFNIGTITGNIIGSTTVNESIKFIVNTAASGSRFSGIITGTGTPDAMSISNNQIAGISANNINTGPVGLAAIYATGNAPGYTITNNIIGSSTLSNSIQNLAPNTATNYDTWGIFVSSGSPVNSISGNTIQNLNSGVSRLLAIRTDGGSSTISNNIIRNGTSAAPGLTGCIGIMSNSTVAGQTISANTIHSLLRTDPTSATAFVYGIYYTGPTAGTNIIQRNFIHSLSLLSSSTASAIYGIRVFNGAFPVDIQNNMIRLGIDASGNSITTGYPIFGIGNASTATTNHYFNTIYIGGSGVTGTTANTYALQASGTGNTRTFLNNILVNNRDGGSTGNHYGFQVAGVGPNPVGLTMNHNLYQATGTNGFAGSYGTNLVDEAAIIAAVGQNSNSVICDPQLINPDGNANVVDLHIKAPPVKTLIEANGLVVAGINTDFDGQTRSALTPTDIGADAGNFAFQAGGCIQILTWNGSSSNVWGTPANWTPSQAPSAITPVIIPGVPTQPAITGSVNVLSLSLQANAAPEVNAGGILNVKGDVTGVGTASIKGAGKVVLNGTIQQNISGVVRISNLELGNSTPQGVVISPGSTLRMEPSSASGSGLLTFLNNSRLTNNGKFVLGSNTLATAKIGPMPASFTLNGDVTIERYLPYTGGVGSWNFIGTPFTGANFTDWVDNFKVVGLNTGFGPQGAGIINSNEPERATIFKYDEPTHDTRLDTVQKQGWRIPGNENIIPGAGYRVWVDHYSNGSHKFDNTGSLVHGSFPFPTLNRNELSGCVPASFPCDEPSLRGWNLLANPYPCDINWDAAGWTKPGTMSDAWYRWHSSANGYGVYASGVYAGTSPEPANPNLIPSNQAFFVRLSAPGNYTASLSLTESTKATSASGQFVRTNVSTEKIRVSLNKPGVVNGYSTVIRFKADATDGFDLAYDFASMGSSSFHISVPVENTPLSIATFAPVMETKVIPITINLAGQAGNFQLTFSEMETLLENHSVFVRDNLLGTLVPVTEGSVYSFSATSFDIGMSNRFELVFNPSTLTSVISSAAHQIGLSVFPNPGTSGESFNVVLNGFEGEVATITITDILGRNIFSKSVSLMGQTLQTEISQYLPAGVYTIKASGKNQTIARQLVVK